MNKVSTFKGLDEIIYESLGLKPMERSEEKLTNKTPCRTLCKHPLPEGFSPEIVSSLFEQVKADWEGEPPRGEKNLILRTCTYIASRSKRKEDILERSIVTLAECGDLSDCWYNQIPVASGLFNSDKKRTAVDLVRVCGDLAKPDFVELIELKWRRHTPLYAMFEVLGYALVLLLSRQNADCLGYAGRNPVEARTLIEAKEVRLVVLASYDDYKGYDRCGLNRFADVVNRGLSDLSFQHLDFPQMSLSFKSFPKDFVQLPFHVGSQIKAMRDGCEQDAHDKLLKAVNSIQPVR